MDVVGEIGEDIRFREGYAGADVGRNLLTGIGEDALEADGRVVLLIGL